MVALFLFVGVVVVWLLSLDKKPNKRRKQKGRKKGRNQYPELDRIYQPEEVGVIGVPKLVNGTMCWYDLEGRRLFNVPKRIRDLALKKGHYIGSIDNVWRLTSKSLTDSRAGETVFVQNHRRAASGGIGCRAQAKSKEKAKSGGAPKTGTNITKVSPRAGTSKKDGGQNDRLNVGTTSPAQIENEDFEAPWSEEQVREYEECRRKEVESGREYLSIDDIDEALGRHQQNYSPSNNQRFIYDGGDYFVQWYYPRSRFADNEIERKDVLHRRFIWDFKDGRNSIEAAEIMANCLYNTFGGEYLRGKTLAVIPASSRQATIRRFQQFSSQLSSRLNIANGFDLIQNNVDRTPKHLGGVNQAEEHIRASERVHNKDLIIVDDITTSGASMTQILHSVRNKGAGSVQFVFFGKTWR